MARAQLPPDAKVDVRSIVAGARQRLGGLAGSELGQSLERIRRGQVPPAASAAPRRVPSPQPIPPIPPARPLQLKLRNGRTVRVAASPAPARRDDLAALGRVCAANDRTAFRSLAGHERAIEELARSQEKLRADLVAIQQRADLALVGFLDWLSGLGRRVESVERQSTVEKASVSAQVARDRRELRSALRRQATAAQLQKVNAAVTSMQGAAFGEKGRLFGTNNLLLAGNQLLWSFIDPVLRALGLWAGPDASPLARWAPLGSLVTAYAALGRRQHVRFVSGVATIAAGEKVAAVPLRDRIASGYFEEFRRRTDIPVTVVVVRGPAIPVRGFVRDGVLFLFLGDESESEVRVAWMVDTGIGNV